jgi:hypothetical protein
MLLSKPDSAECEMDPLIFSVFFQKVQSARKTMVTSMNRRFFYMYVESHECKSIHSPVGAANENDRKDAIHQTTNQHVQKFLTD